MRHKVTTEYFFEKIKENPNYPDIIILTKEIKGKKTPIDCICKQCGHKWTTNADHLLYGKAGCGKCKGNVKLTHDEFIEDMKQLHPNIEFYGVYVNNRTKIDAKCKICGNEWKTDQSHLKQGTGCPRCSWNKMADRTRKSLDDFVSELYSINPLIEVVGDYISSKTPIECNCKMCGKTWSSTPNNLLGGTGCPKCNISKGESKIGEALDFMGIQYETQKKFAECRDKRKLPFDFYISSLNICIEYDGIQHFEPTTFGGVKCYDEAVEQFKQCKQRDEIKNKYCENNGIKLIRIPYTEFDNIEKILSENLS